MHKIGWLRKLFGDRGERVAAKFLKAKGYRIIARQARSRFGEIDIVALDRDSIVFVEVKTRSSHLAGRPEEAVDNRKQQQLTKSALVWLKQRNLLEHRARFDVIAITWHTGKPPEIQHFENAFPPTGFGQMFS